AAAADAGYRTLLIERSADPLDTARGDHLQPISCEALERWGVLGRMFERGAEKRLGSRWLLPDGELVVATPADNLPIPHPYHLYLNHELISEVLLERAADNPDFSILRPATARVMPDAVAPGTHGLTVERDGEQRAINAHCIAIADGRSSRGRKSLGIDATEHQYENPLLTLFARRTFTDPRNDLNVYLTPAGIVSVVPRMGGNWKIGFPVARAELGDWAGASPKDIGARLSGLVPALAGIEPHYAGVYPVAMVNASTWASGNAVLLGDACHALHPGRSQGMNVALRGVARLAERLRDSDFPASPDAVPALLADLEAELKPPIDARLDENHARGLAMDRMDAASVEQTRQAMAALAASPEKLHAYCMNAAGY
ncbi:MAG: FAD-dependent monooxygenase, partial [Gammaproteobacteria bacterium]|nr:FAD-dependent monooxygenase [Gammaproteobacteria bacterium]